VHASLQCDCEGDVPGRCQRDRDLAGQYARSGGTFPRSRTRNEGGRA
jgi:hypothetical protein